MRQLAYGDSIVDGEHFNINGTFVFSITNGISRRANILLKLSAAAQSILAEGSTGSFFDTDIAIFNPSASKTVETKVRFLREDGGNIENTHQLEPQSRTLIHADDVPGLEGASILDRRRSAGGRRRSSSSG